MAAIELAGIEKRFGESHAVRGVDLAIASGEFVVILGPSGCGKSTLLRMIAGLEAVSAGTVSLDGVPMNGVEPGRRGCAMVFQNYALYPHMTVAENIGYGLRVAGVPKREREARVRSTAAMLDIETLLDRRPAALSGGQRQRVAMGRAMIRNPRVFLFDEPLSNLDAILRQQMRGEIKRLHRELRTTSVFVTHDQVEAMGMADRLVVMNAGRVEQVGPPADVFRRPASRFVAGFIGAPRMNLIDAAVTAEGTLAVGGWRPCDGLRFRAAAGRAVHLGVRPDALAPMPPAGGGPVFTADLVEDLGTEIHVHARGEGIDLILQRHADAPPIDTSFAVAIPPRAVHLFDAETGLRIEPDAAETLRQGAPAWDARRHSSI
ncbi:sn-glycerol-3-phosphate ABC transporter ATP-binding protein UgpC [Jiella endophytica]|uniref:sn-glycerol-3-phosphate ABC transporter ATP-binding protein UgpC n=1 Tax=Jiella endophytica TaxID=2558362 RepID=A0A4Y8RM83_9HYPH|nr:sn-glycerol-3-phosphate ABC transporter ATP-binding protein UgpC [Jiella endophytica]TFF23233.1 sn-glycerol-3-phosphate ABC transporter ATP-binding protein UgpC [Jiella endophytica]